MNNNELDIIINDEVIILNKIKTYFYLIIKRFFDLLIAVIGTVLLIPISLIIKICYVVTGDYESIFYSQKRIGKNGKIFKMYKFRTMVPNADEELNKLLKKKKYKDEWNKFQKLSNDPRITKIGNLLRKTSLDEMPQFINILKGDLTLIGPRPLIEGELDKFGGDHKLYESIKPGITGWWAANGRSATTYEDRLNLEYYYIKNRSLSLDIKCIFRTIKIVISRNGAK